MFLRVIVSTIVLSYLSFVIALLAIWRAMRDERLYKRRVEALRQKSLQLEALLARRGVLANEIAHEIKNPITAILCSAESLDLILADKIDPAHRDILRYIKEYGDNLLRLVSDFLDISMAESGNISARPEVLKVQPVVDSIVGLLQSNAIKKHIDVSYHLESSDLAVLTDSKHFKQVLFNLVHNAIKFTDRFGKVQIQIGRDDGGSMIAFTVSDNGPGIPPEAQSSVFDLYSRFEGSRNDTGCGLGLALCKALVGLNGGSISVQSTENVGTSFTFRLPVGNPVVSGREHSLGMGQNEAPALCRPLMGQTFLVVDGDLGSREAISKLIEAWGGAVDQVGLAIDAVSALTNKSYDAVMIDNAPDGVVGYELARMIRNDMKAKNTTIILASRDPIDKQLAREAGADKWVEKPLNGKLLLNSLLSPRDIEVM